MINKQNLWFMTLFCLILVLSVYYVTMPSELLMSTNNTNKQETGEPTVYIEESELLTALRVEADEAMQSEMDDLKFILTNIDSSIEEKNNAFDKMKELNKIRGEEETLEKKIVSTYNLKSFVKITGNQIRVVVQSEKHDETLANNIMRSIQENYDTPKYISVKFQK